MAQRFQDLGGVLVMNYFYSFNCFLRGQNDHILLKG